MVMISAVLLVILLTANLMVRSMLVSVVLSAALLMDRSVVLSVILSAALLMDHSVDRSMDLSVALLMDHSVVHSVILLVVHSVAPLVVLVVLSVVHLVAPLVVLVVHSVLLSVAPLVVLVVLSVAPLVVLVVLSVAPLVVLVVHSVVLSVDLSVVHLAYPLADRSVDPSDHPVLMTDLTLSKIKVHKELTVCFPRVTVCLLEKSISRDLCWTVLIFAFYSIGGGFPFGDDFYGGVPGPFFEPVPFPGGHGSKKQ
jgi:hypothetical protein